jgi:2-oxoisovalerate dehydrogenase E1 component
MDTDDLLTAYGRMVTIRRLEERIATLYAGDAIPGFVHTSLGQEACAVGALFHARMSDVITSTHRGHGHVVAKGLEPRRVLAELMGKQAGSNRGRGGSMHVADPNLGILGANGIVGAGLPIGVGAAYALRSRGDGDIVVCFFGDGAVSTGAFHESMNLAALWRLPIVFFCEDNGFSEFSRSADQQPVPIARRAGAYGIPSVELPGDDVGAVADGMLRTLDRVRRGEGPALVVAHTVRVHGHYEGDQQRYRDADAMSAEIAAADPVRRARAVLLERHVAEDKIDAVEQGVDAAIDEAEQFARSAAAPSASTALDHVYVARGTATPGSPAGEDRPLLSQSRIIRKALEDALADDPAVFLAGIDVAGGNVFGVTRGLADAFPGRVLDTPIAETAIMGLGVGASMLGLRPVVELMYLDFLGVCLDQLMNQAAKLPLMTGGAVTVPMVVRTQFGSGRSSGAQHSQSLEALLAHIPGLTVVMPSSGTEAYGLLRSAIEDDNPVVFLEHRLLYEKRSPLPPPTYRLPIGRAHVVRPGSDVTIVSWSRMVTHALTAADSLADDGIRAEVVDLRTIVPLDRAAILESFARTNRMVIAQEAVTDFGVGAEIAALAVSSGFHSLDAPVLRVGAAFGPAPYAPVLEREWEAGPAEIEAAVREVMAC